MLLQIQMESTKCTKVEIGLGANEKEGDASLTETTLKFLMKQ